MLIKNNITEIVNCAGDYCPNWFESMKDDDDGNFRYKYLTFFLKDSQNENIECLFYRVIDFIDSALKNGKNVLVHCIQGISRSVTFVLAYLIFTKGFDYKQA
jgi:protein-tyrosine phosphatase